MQKVNMFKSIQLLLTFIFIMLLGCNNGNSIYVSNEPTVIKIGGNPTVNSLADSLVENGRMVVLESKKSNLIQTISIVRMTKDRIYILDKDIKKIFVFHTSGELDYEIEGKSENYPDFFDIGIDTSLNEIQALSVSDAVMYRYRRGKFVSQKHIRFWSSEFFLVDPDTILFYQGFVNNKWGKNNAHLLLTDSEFNLSKKFLPIKEKEDVDFAFKYGVAEFHLFASNDKLNVLKEDSYEVYRYPMFDAPKYKFDFGENGFKNKLDVSSLEANLIRTKYAILTDFWETKNTIAFSFSLDNKRTICYYNKLSKKMLKVNAGEMENLFNFLAYRVKGVHRDEFYGQIPGEAIPFVIKSLEKKKNHSAELNEMLIRLKEIKMVNGKHNPIFVFFKVKDF